MNRIKTFFVVTIVLGMVACGEPAGTEEVYDESRELLPNPEGYIKDTNWKTFEKEGFTIDYPTEWQLDVSGSMGTVFLLFSGLSGEGDTFNENINLCMQNLEGQNLDLDAYVALTESQLPNAIENSKILRSERMGDYHHIMYDGTMQGIDLRFKQYYWLKDDVAYLLTFSAQRSDYDQYASVAAKIMASFQLKP